MAQTLYDDRLNNIKTWPNYHTVNYAEQLEEDDNENRVSDHNYVICVKKPPDERVEKFYNGNIPDSLDNYIRRINASYFMTVDNLTKDIWADDSESIEPSETKSPPPYIPNTYAIRRIVKNSVWNNTSDPNKYKFIVRLVNVSGDTNGNWKAVPSATYSYTDDTRLYAGRRYKFLFKVKDDLNVNSFTVSNIAVYNKVIANTDIPATYTTYSITSSKTFNKGEEASLTYVPTYNDLRYLYLNGHAADFDYVEIYANYTDKQEVPSNSAIQTIINKSIWNSMSSTATNPGYSYHNIASSGAVKDLLVYDIWSKDKAVLEYNKNATYAVGDECLYNNTCYRCTSAANRENWNFSHWKEINTVESNGYNLFVPNVRAIQNIIKSDLWSSYSNANKVVPTVGAIQSSIVTSISTSLPSNNKIPTEKAVYDFITQTGAELVTIKGILYVKQKYYFSGTWYYTLSQAYYLQ